MKCDDCGFSICVCADDVKFVTPPIIFTYEEQIKELSKQNEELQQKLRDLDWQYEELMKRRQQLKIYKGLLKEVLQSNAYYGDIPYVFDYIEFHNLEKDLNEEI